MSKPRTVHHKTEWQRAQDAVYWIHLAKAQEQCITFLQTKSHAISAHKTVPLDCIERVISQKGETTLYQRLSTPRPAPRIILKNAWNHQQQQEQQGDLGSFRKLKRERHEGDNKRVKAAAGNCSENNVVREEDSFQVDLRAHGVSQDAIHKDEERVVKMQPLVAKLQIGYRDKSIINDFTIKEWGNIELYDLGEISKTVQCPSCLKCSKDCLC